MKSLISPIVGRIIGIIFFVTLGFFVTPTSAFAIIGGEDANDGEQDWMVALALADVEDGYYAHFCGGTLIDEGWVLTAAHCTYDKNGAPFTADALDVLIDRHHLSRNTGKRIRVSHIIRHPSFDPATYDSDIALLQLSAPTTVSAVALFTDSLKSDSINATNDATAFGWGVADNGNGVDSLRHVTLPLVNNGDCGASYASFNRVVTDNMLCAGFALGGKDTCTGDSGGPLAVFDRSSNSWVQIGIVSWGEGCAEAGAYGVYTTVSAFTSWISFQLAFYSLT